MLTQPGLGQGTAQSVGLNTLSFLVSNISFPLQAGHSALMCWRQSGPSPMCSGLLSRFDLEHRIIYQIKSYPSPRIPLFNVRPLTGPIIFDLKSSGDIASI